MILFTILMLMIIALTMITVLAIAAGGTVFIVVFGDVIVCIVFLTWIIKRLFRRKKR